MEELGEGLQNNFDGDIPFGKSVLWFLILCLLCGSESVYQFLSPEEISISIMVEQVIGH